MIVVVSNREVNKNASDHEIFGDKPNKKGLDELRVATAEYDKDKDTWKVKLLAEKNKDVRANKPPSRQLFDRVLKEVTIKKLTGDWVVFVHGFNQSFLKNLTKCRHLEELYGVNVLAFSWPSNQGGFKPNEYKKSRAAAKASTNAFDRMLEKLSAYLADRPFSDECSIRVSLMAYSLGNFVVENFVRAPVFTAETKVFENILLTQADVNLKGHAEWIGSMQHGKRVYVTINEDDSVLKLSDVVNPSRLGNTAKHLDAADVVYFDFTDGKDVGSTHGLFHKTARVNGVVKEVFRRALIGKRPEKIGEGLTFNEGSNAWELTEKQ
jgi:esterase/lipase superfamily enzyme